MVYGLLVIAVFLIVFGLVLNATNNFASKLIFKVIPFFSGLFLLFYFLVEKGIVLI